MKEVWKNINGYDGAYQISNSGKVKSFKRNKKGAILKSANDGRGYLTVGLSKKGVQETCRIHVLVAIYFLNHKQNGKQDIVVDHIDNDKLNNNLSNLQLITNRKNTSKDRKGGNSKYVGVFYYKYTKRWMAHITINNKKKHIGYFSSELEAHEAYQSELKKIEKL